MSRTILSRREINFCGFDHPFADVRPNASSEALPTRVSILDEERVGKLFNLWFSYNATPCCTSWFRVTCHGPSNDGVIFSTCYRVLLKSLFEHRWLSNAIIGDETQSNSIALPVHKKFLLRLSLSSVELASKKFFVSERNTERSELHWRTFRPRDRSTQRNRVIAKNFLAPRWRVQQKFFLLTTQLNPTSSLHGKFFHSSSKLGVGWSNVTQSFEFRYRTWFNFVDANFWNSNHDRFRLRDIQSEKVI